MSKETGDDRGHLKTNSASVLCEHEQALLKACQRRWFKHVWIGRVVQRRVTYNNTLRVEVKMLRFKTSVDKSSIEQV